MTSPHMQVGVCREVTSAKSKMFSMRSKERSPVIIIVIFVLSPVFSYHNPTQENVDYHCWWDNASQSHPFPITCQGISIEWVIPPPSKVILEDHFNVSYRLRVEDSFYDARFGFNYPEYKNNTMTGDDLKDFCHHSPCPTQLADSPEEFKLQCCIWHANIHVCHPGECGKPDQICGPWVNNDQIQSTHTAAKYGNINETFSAEVHIDVAQHNYMIAHIKLGRLQLAVQSIIFVTEYYCGDGKCSNDESCSSCPRDCCISMPSYAIALLVIFALFFTIVVLTVIVVVLLWFYYQRRKLFYDESWIIDYSKIKRVENGYGGLLGSNISLRNMKFLNGETESTSEVGMNDMSTNMMCDALKRQLFTQTGSFEGRTVAIKKISQSSDFQLTKAIRKEVMRVRVLDHQNLCKFIGATVQSPGNVAIISEYCPKGSLNDVLQNEDIPLNWGFRFSFATDIARGMGYLHQKKIYHNRLRSTNCVIDDRWVVKISDYGLPSFRIHSLESDSEEGRDHVIKLYSAPEDRDKKYPTPTPAGNVYSYSIILLEIGTRMDPYSEELFVDSKGRPKEPDLSESGCPSSDQYLDLLRRCWDTVPTSRPSFDQIKKTLYRMNPNRESPVDMMMIMMEKYSKHLEVLVAERTQELIAEQRKTSQLLYSMLPKTVADDLRQGRPAAAQAFESATIYFSDIVGFTSLASGSTAMEIVSLLNELYSTFDAILDKFDVYKVETIGDAYMVVSGVPRENGNKHAGEIARMALHLILATRRFKIPHRPNDKLKIRVGIHTGPVCAGVVGLKMPRYCLFGDTVNTASRMETTSEEMRIQCSNSTYQVLKKTGGFTLECRGTVNVRGKGMMTTWWIMGEDDSPSLSPTNNKIKDYTSTDIEELVKSPAKSLLNNNNIVLPGSPCIN